MKRERREIKTKREGEQETGGGEKEVANAARHLVKRPKWRRKSLS